MLLLAPDSFTAKYPDPLGSTNIFPFAPCPNTNDAPEEPPESVRLVAAGAVTELIPVNAAAKAKVPVVKLRLLARVTEDTALDTFPYRRVDAVVPERIRLDATVAVPPTVRFWSIVREEVTPREIAMVVCPCVYPVLS